MDSLLRNRLNLCAEGSYSKGAINCFGGRNTHYCIEDHNACSLSNHYHYHSMILRSN